MDAAFKSPRAPPELGGTVDQIFPRQYKLRVLTFQTDTLFSRRQADPQAVRQTNCLVYGSDFMETVRTFGEDFKSGVDLGKGAGLNGFLHDTWQEVIRA